MKVPSARDKGMLRRGSFTSPAVNVMLFQASAENSEPVCATQMATNNPNAVTAERPGTMGAAERTVQSAPKLSDTAVLFQPTRMPSRIKAASAPLLVVVKTF